MTTRDNAVMCTYAVLAVAAVAGGNALVYAMTAVSDPLTLADANAALAAQGGMVGNIFAVGDNRYLVSRSRLIGKRGSDVFVGEVEITRLPKHLN